MMPNYPMAAAGSSSERKRRAGTVARYGESSRTRYVGGYEVYNGLDEIVSQRKNRVSRFLDFDIDASRNWYIPEEILEKIMQCVFFQDLMRWRRVCKRWNLGIMCREWCSPANFRSQTSFPVLMPSKEKSEKDAALMTLGPDQSKWTKIDVGLIFMSLNLFCSNGRQCSPCFRCTTAGSLGLMFYTCYCDVHPNSDLSLIICNPALMLMKGLDLPLISSEYLIHSDGYLRLAGVIVNSEDTHYKLLFATSVPRSVSGSLRDKSEGHTFSVYSVYDSETRSWKWGRGPVHALPFISSRVSCNDCFYFLYPRVDDFDPELRKWPLLDPKMGKYDAEADTWGDITNLPKSEGCLQLPQIVRFKNTVFFMTVGRCSMQGEDEYCKLTWCFFKLNESAPSARYMWTKVREMPLQHFGMLYLFTGNFYDLTIGRQDVCCEGQGDNLYFYSIQPLSQNVEQPSLGRQVPQFKNGVLLTHDYEKNTWTFAQRYPPFPRSDPSVIYRLESFRPSFMNP